MRGRIEESNPAAVELLHEPLEGELWRDIIHRSFEPGSQTGQEARLQDGRTVSISTCPRGDEPGQIILLMDVTETHFLQQALSRHQRLSAMGEMSAKLAHQIRTPLASALLYTSNMSKGTLKAEEREKFINKTLSRLQHMENVVEDMLSFSRVGELGHDLISLSDLLEELKQAMETHLDADGCHLALEDINDKIVLSANRDALLGVLQNLITNAIQACGENGELNLSVKCVDQTHGIPSIDIILSDNGPGIPSDVLNSIFDPFFTTRAKGTGLGLSVAKAVVENHGGSIWVESSGENGTTFIIRLPIARTNNELRDNFVS
jgi:two-component system sensor histidine kinase FlrB